jgi:hypothetical protein
MNEIIEIIAIGCIGVLFVAAEPIILLKRYFGFKEERYDDMSKIMRFFHRMLSCALCSGFWIALALTQNLYWAAICSVLAEAIYKHIKS